MENTVCQRCRAEISAADNFCRRCGLQLKTPDGEEFAEVQIVPEAAPDRPKYADSPGLVLLMLFLVLGPFALPMLWKGRAFSRQWKWILTFLTVAYLLALFWLTWFLIVKLIVEPFVQLRPWENFAG
jgi:hypothetical protein